MLFNFRFTSFIRPSDKVLLKNMVSKAVNTSHSKHLSHLILGFGLICISAFTIWLSPYLALFLEEDYIIESSLLLIAYVTLDVIKYRYLSLRAKIEREIATGIFYYCIVYFLHFVLNKALANFTSNDLIYRVAWFANIFVPILLTAVFFKGVVKTEIKFKLFSEKVNSLEGKIAAIFGKMNELSQTFEDFRMSSSSQMRLTSIDLTRIEKQVKLIEDNYGKIVQAYNSLLIKYQSEATLANQKRQQYEVLLERTEGLCESLLPQIEELTRLQDEYRRKLDHTPSSEIEDITKKDKTPLKLTTEDGIANRRKGNNAQIKTAEFLEKMGFELKNDCEKDVPDYFLLKEGAIVGIGAHKAFTLTKEGTRQRSISKENIDAECEAAREFECSLVIFVTNLANGQRWARLIPNGELGSFKSITTPLILAENSAEAYKTLQESLLRVKEQLGYT